MNELIQLGRASSELHEFEKGKKKKDGWLNRQAAALRAGSEGSDRTRKKKKAKDNKASYASSAAVGAAVGAASGKYKTGIFRRETKRDKLVRQKSNRRKFGRRALVGAGIGALVSEASRRMNNSNKKTPTGVPHPDLYEKRMKGQVAGGAKGGAIGAALGGIAGKAMSIYRARKGKFKSDHGGAILGAIGGGASGLAVGSTVGDYKAKKKYLDKKGVKLRKLGLDVELNKNARRKYLK